MSRIYGFICVLLATLASPFCMEALATHGITISHPVNATYNAGASLTVDGNIYYTWGYDTAPARVRVRIFDMNATYLLDVVASTYSASQGTGYYAENTSVPDATDPTKKESQTYSAHSEDSSGAILRGYPERSSGFYLDFRIIE